MTKLSLPPVYGQFTRLRLLEERDLEMIRGWRNKPRARRWFNFSEEISPDAHCAWYDKYSQSADDYMFICEDMERDMLPVAVAGVYNFNWDKRTAEIGRFVVGEQSALGTKVINDVHPPMFKLFESIGLREFHCEVKKDNHLALRMFNDLGYKHSSFGDQMVYLTYRGEMKP